MEMILIEISVGELLDKVTILQIKTRRMTDPLKLKNVEFELGLLNSVVSEKVKMDKDLLCLVDELRQANEAIWDAEDKIRWFEINKQFDASFVEVARVAYLSNDRRSSIKNAINSLIGSRVVEEKEYPAYQILQQP